MSFRIHSSATRAIPDQSANLSTVASEADEWFVSREFMTGIHRVMLKRFGVGNGADRYRDAYRAIAASGWMVAAA